MQNELRTEIKNTSLFVYQTNKLIREYNILGKIERCPICLAPSKTKWCKFHKSFLRTGYPPLPKKLLAIGEYTVNPINNAPTNAITKDIFTLRRYSRSISSIGLEDLSNILAAALLTILEYHRVEQADFITFIPSSNSFLSQTLEQISKLIARTISAIFLSPDTFLKVDTNIRITPLGKQERVQAVKLKFQPKVIAKKYDGSSLLLLDDLFHTGSTLNCVASIFFSYGFSDISALVLAALYTK